MVLCGLPLRLQLPLWLQLLDCDVYLDVPCFYAGVVGCWLLFVTNPLPFWRFGIKVVGPGNFPIIGANYGWLIVNSHVVGANLYGFIINCSIWQVVDLS